MNKFNRRLIWAASNTVPVGLVAIGTTFGVSGFVTFGIMLFWFLILLTMFGGYSEAFFDEIKDNEEFVDKVVNDRALPLWADYAIDIPVAIYLAFVGFPITAFFFILHIFGYTEMHKKLKASEDGKKEDQARDSDGQ